MVVCCMRGIAILIPHFNVYVVFALMRDIVCSFICRRSRLSVNSPIDSTLQLRLCDAGCGIWTRYGVSERFLT
jgi:hypothetical protein